MKFMRTMGWVALALSVSGASPAAPVNSLFNPADYAAVDTNVVLTGGSILIDTKDGTNAPTWSFGSTNYFGQIVTNQSGSVVMALFPFAGLAISNAVSCTVTGNLGLVIASSADLTLGNTLDLGGRNGIAAAGGGGLGGPGGEAGGRTVSFTSAPPSAVHGKGASGYGVGYMSPVSGIGFGGGGSGGAAGGGGGYGGLGGIGYSSGQTTPGGTNYGDSVLAKLYGGSGGGAGGNSSTGPSGGGGGGSLELIANGTLTLTSTSTQKVNGGAALGATDRSAGGGSGGGLVLAASVLTVRGAIQANGGNGASGQQGGGGGGGRVVFYAQTLSTNGMTLSVAGGLKSAAPAEDGAPGTFRYAGDGLHNDPVNGDLGYPFGSTVLPPQIVNAGGSNVPVRTATMYGNLLSRGGAATEVFCYLGTNPATWTLISLGTQPVSIVTNYVSGLQPSTRYYYQFAASNSAGWGYAPATNTLDTLPLSPVLVNAGSTNVTAASATVYGSMISTGESVTVCYLLYGTTGGIWAFTNTVGGVGNGTISNNLVGLQQNTVYYYQFAASNADSWGYAPSTNTFTTWAQLGQQAQTNSLWNPASYAMLADALTITGGTLRIDTGNGTNLGPVMTTALAGVTNSYRGQVVPSQKSNVWFALFNFGNLAISNAVSCTVTGNLGLALAATGSMTIACTFDLSGIGAVVNVGGGLGGPGAEAGTRTNTFRSAPPGATHGSGGNTGFSGVGYGGGLSYSTDGGGGGYGGLGGYGHDTGSNYAAGGTNYGDGVMSVLYGGSGGAGGSSSAGYGGGGGGALAVIANGSLTVTTAAVLRVNGGNGAATGWRSGGGGSGGGILLAGNYVTVSGSVQAKGGNGAAGMDQGGGGGGGGRIAIYANMLTTNGMSASVTNGVKAVPGQDGAMGTFRCLNDGQGGNLSYPYASIKTVPLIDNAGVANLQPRSATLNANLQFLGGDPSAVVFGYWGANPSASDNATNLGAQVVGTVPNNVSGLLPNTTYYYTFAASNSSGWGYATHTNSFTTLVTWPVIANTGSDTITTNSAHVSAYLSNTGESVTVVFVLYGTTPGSWTGQSTVGPCAIGAVSNTLSGLLPATLYYYTFAATNATGWAYAPTTNSFLTRPALGAPATAGSLFDPRRYALTADALTITNGSTWTIDTGDGTNRAPSMAVNGSIYAGAVVPTASNRAWLALFNFNNLVVNSAVSCTVTGNLGLVLACRNNMTLAGTLELGGTNAVDGLVGPGGPGGESGVPMTSTNSAPPTAKHGSGGAAAEGIAPGGFGGGVNGDMSAGGGGYGGMGGIGKFETSQAFAGGTNYGDSALSDLLGGSGGGGGSFGYGGGGGGALELIANNILTVSATSTQKVNGGNGAGGRAGGGGSGGAILVAARKLVVAGTLQAKGGNGSTSYGNRGGGGGGGGRIAFYANILETNGMNVSVAGGAVGLVGFGTDGTNGTFRFPGDGEPAAMAFPFAFKGTAVFFR
jgi:hypothetical protein